MKKLKLSDFADKEVLTREQLKNVLGGVADGAWYSCACNNGNTTSFYASNSTTAFEAVYMACGNSGGGCTKGQTIPVA
ncbi:MULTISPECIES: hypothetical protein [Chitinophagaceae]